MPQIDITTNIGCVSKCLYCPQDKVINAYKERSGILEMSLETFKICVDKLPLHSDLFFGGFSEPWLNQDCTKMVLYARKKAHFTIGVATTLVGMTPLDIELLEEIPFRCFRVHLPSKDGYEKIDIDENYINVLTKLRKSRINAGYHYHGGALQPQIKLLIGHSAVRVLTITRSRNDPEIVDIPLFRKKRGELACGFDNELNSNELLPNGDVLLCCCDFGIEHNLGNLLTQDYESLFLSAEFTKIKSGLINNSSEVLCRYCVASYNIRHDLSFYINLLHYDVFFLASKAYLSFLRKCPLLNNKIARNILRLFGIKNFRFPP